MRTGATTEATRGYAARMAAVAAPRHFRERLDLHASSIGIGTYLGAPDDRTDELYAEAVVACVRGGVNVIDTAINYRLERSERAVGNALRELVRSGVARGEVVLSTKGGYIPARDAVRYFRDEIVAHGLARMDELAASCHSLAPLYLRRELERSLDHLGVDCIDVYYVHNPETQLEEVQRERFLARLRKTFEMLEKAAQEGLIRCYGTATWNGYRLSPEERGHLPLEEVCQAARSAGGVNHHFRVVQLPINLAMREAVRKKTQIVDGERCTLLEAADRLGIAVVASGSLLQGRVLPDVPRELKTHLKQTSDAGAALQLVRSLPGVWTALVGMKSPDHVRRNLELVKVSPADEASLASWLRES